MTIEGRPELNVDWKEQYAKQRRNRLADSINEYLEDDEVTIDEFYNDLKAEIEEVITYHKIRKEKAVGALQLVLGHRNVTIDEDLSEKWKMDIPGRY